MSDVTVSGLCIDVGRTRVCDQLDLALKPGEVWSVIGRNGAGKTTLLHTLAGLRAPQAGSISIDGSNVHRVSARVRAQRISILFQQLDEMSSLTGHEILINARHPWVSRWEGIQEQDEEIVQRVVHEHDIVHLVDRPVGILSGGERRRIELAAVAVQDTGVILLDEPVNHLDLHFQVETLSALLNQWRAQDKIVMMVMHDLNLATRFSDQLLCLMGHGESLSGPTKTIATEENFSRLMKHPIRRYDAHGQTVFVPL
ncbi:MAG: ABC transporter ATP-binding protein [Arenicellales bacterium]